ncbi:MAG: prepilin peptidase, partial [Planctomycetes bacterium]|nr:prepilin peptidase [Planctomycetota bacterium]
MTFAQWQFWPVWFICGGMIASAIIDWWKFKVPNKLTFPIILSGWALGLIHTGLGFFPTLCPAALQGGVGGIGASLAGTALGFFLLWPVYAVGGMGAGDVKMTMGFGSWIGAFFGFEHNCLGIIFYSFCAGVIVGGVIGLGMILVREQFQKNVAHTRAIIMDLFTSGIGDLAAKANQRRSRWHRLPYGVPLCIGFVGCLVYLFVVVPAQPDQAT